MDLNQNIGNAERFQPDQSVAPIVIDQSGHMSFALDRANRASAEAQRPAPPAHPALGAMPIPN